VHASTASRKPRDVISLTDEAKKRHAARMFAWEEQVSTVTKLPGTARQLVPVLRKRMDHNGVSKPI
jgi:hypothetical protein